jgi:3-(methylthio)propanoyl-CoA dehydrogenase
LLFIQKHKGLIMSVYVAPLKDMQFVLNELAGMDRISQLPGCEEISADLVEAVLEEAGKFAAGVLAPLNKVGDKEGVRWATSGVSTATGWKEAYAQFVAGGWNAMSCEPEYGGQGIPRVVCTLVEEMWNSANVSFTLCPMLTRGAIEAIELRGSVALKEAYLPKLISGEWTGTMNLTEPQAGSDLAAIRSRAVPQTDGTYRVHGQKIFITYGDHDIADNIIHLVLARTPDAPEGVKGISLFVVPKFLLAADGTPGARNDVHCVSVEHKLGIHASPTCVMAFGDGQGAEGYLVGEENRGIEYMFIMMNAARFSVGLEGIGLAERAYQRATAYARDRVQCSEAGVRGGGKVAIIRHPDVRRMLMLMKSQAEAMRTLACVVGAAMDHAQRSADPAERLQNQAFVDLMIPIVKGWSTETSISVASLGVQIHGGMGYIEETGAAQHLRDARITTIYEGTTAIQANDLIGRKIAREGGKTIGLVIQQMREVEQQLAQGGTAAFAAIGKSLAAATTALEQAVAYIVANYAGNVQATLVGAVPFLQLFGTVAGGWQLARGALAAQRLLDAGNPDTAFLKAKIVTARFYADHVLSQAPGLAYAVVEGAAGALEIADDQL